MQCTHGYTVYECMYACTDYDLLIMYKCANFSEKKNSFTHSLIHSFLVKVSKIPISINFSKI